MAGYLVLGILALACFFFGLEIRKGYIEVARDRERRK
jgi:hypothetical protein